MTNAQMDPWSTGTPGYRRALITGMAGSGMGVLCLVLAAVISEDGFGTLRTLGAVLIGVGIVAHLTGLVLRKRQAASIVRNRHRSQPGAERKGTP